MLEVPSPSLPNTVSSPACRLCCPLLPVAYHWTSPCLTWPSVCPVVSYLSLSGLAGPPSGLPSPLCWDHLDIFVLNYWVCIVYGFCHPPSFWPFLVFPISLFLGGRSSSTSVRHSSLYLSSFLMSYIIFCLFSILLIWPILLLLWFLLQAS